MAPQWQQNPLLVHMAMNAPFCCNEAFHPPDGNDAPVLRKARARLHAAVMQGNILFSQNATSLNVPSLTACFIQS